MKNYCKVSGRRFRSLKKNQEGAVAIVVALSLFVLVLGAGVAIDMARAQMVQTKIQSSLDAAGLAAAASLTNVPEGMDKAIWVQTKAQSFFNMNFQVGYMGTVAPTVSTTLSEDGSTISLTANTTQSTTLMNLVGIDTINVAASSQVTVSSSGIGMELVLVLDNTGSMNCDIDSPACDGGPNSKIVALKSAANELLDILYGPMNDTATGLFVGVVPFSQAVNVGKKHKDWLELYFNYHTGMYYLTGQDVIDAYDWGPGGDWGGCVSTQAGWSGWSVYTYDPYGYPFSPYWYPPEEAYTYDPTGGLPIAPDKSVADALQARYGYYWNYNPMPSDPATPATWRINGWKDDLATPVTYMSPLDTTHQGPNLGCPQPITEMTKSKSTVKTAISTMVPTGDTIIPEGAVWAARMLSPSWRPYWGGEMGDNGLPLDYDAPNSRKVVIIMSDGWNHFLPYNYTAYGFKNDFEDYVLGAYYSWETVEQTLDRITSEICDKMKSDGTTIYTVGFGKAGLGPDDDSSVNADLLRDCATDADHFFLAPTNAELHAAFHKIGLELSGLRVSK